MLTVYRQAPPVPLGIRLTRYDRYGDLREDEWHRANLVKVGECETWEEAKRMTLHPVVEERRP